MFVPDLGITRAILFVALFKKADLTLFLLAENNGERIRILKIKGAEK